MANGCISTERCSPSFAAVLSNEPRTAKSARLTSSHERSGKSIGSAKKMNSYERRSAITNKLKSQGCKMPNKYTQQTYRELERRNYVFQSVEKYNSFSGKRNDFFGVIDVIAVCHGETLGVQSTSWGDISSHVKEAYAESRLYSWLDGNNLFEIWGWRMADDGWELKVIEITKDDLLRNFKTGLDTQG